MPARLLTHVYFPHQNRLFLPINVWKCVALWLAQTHTRGIFKRQKMNWAKNFRMHDEKRSNKTNISNHLRLYGWEKQRISERACLREQRNCWKESYGKLWSNCQLVMFHVCMKLLPYTLLWGKTRRIMTSPKNVFQCWIGSSLRTAYDFRSEKAVWKTRKCILALTFELKKTRTLLSFSRCVAFRSVSNVNACWTKPKAPFIALLVSIRLLHRNTHERMCQMFDMCVCVCSMCVRQALCADVKTAEKKYCFFSTHSSSHCRFVHFHHSMGNRSSRYFDGANCCCYMWIS